MLKVYFLPKKQRGPCKNMEKVTLQQSIFIRVPFNLMRDLFLVQKELSKAVLKYPAR